MRSPGRSCVWVALALAGCIEIPPFTAPPSARADALTLDLLDTGDLFGGEDAPSGGEDAPSGGEDVPSGGEDAPSVDLSDGDLPGDGDLGPESDIEGPLGDAVEPDGHAPDGGAPDVPIGDPLSALSDEFLEASLSAWSTLTPAGGTALVDTSADGRLVLTPDSLGWFEHDRGMFLYHLVTGDFVVEAALTVATATSATEAPAGTYQVAGLLARDPDGVGGTESWVLVEMGIAATAGVAQSTRKTTHDAVTEQWPISPALRQGLLRLCRQGNTFTVYARADEATTLGAGVGVQWTDGVAPNTLQVGLLAGRYLNTGNMVGYVDWVRFGTPGAAQGCATELLPP